MRCISTSTVAHLWRGKEIKNQPKHKRQKSQSSNKAYQENRGLIENLCPHFSHHLSFTGNTDIGDQTLRSSLERRHDLGLRGGDGSLNAASTGLCNLTTEFLQRLDIAGMDGQHMHGSAFGSAFGERPTLEGTGTGVNDILGIGAGQGRGKGHIHGQVDGRIDPGRRSHGRSTMRATKRLRGQVSGVWPGHAKRRGHTFPAMTGLAGKIGDLVHSQDESGWTLFAP